MIALFLRALVGEKNEDIFTDYELTSLYSYAYGISEGVDSLGFRSRFSDYFRKFMTTYNTYEGETLCERTEAFLLECNVKPETIDKVRRIIKKQSSCVI